MEIKRAVLTSIILFLPFIMLKYAKVSQEIDLRKSFKDFPLKIDEWSGRKGFLSEKTIKVSGVDEYLLIDYTHEKKLIQIYIGYYKSQKKGDLIHSPKNCLPGSGWHIESVKPDKIRVNKLKKELNVTRLKLSKPGRSVIAYYWFNSRGRVISNEYMQKFWLVFDSIIKRRTDGACIRIISSNTETELESIDELKKFINSAYPIIKEFLPQ